MTLVGAFTLTFTIPINGPKSEASPTRKTELNWVRGGRFARRLKASFRLLDFCKNKLVYQRSRTNQSSAHETKCSTRRREHTIASFNFRPGYRIFKDLRVVYRLEMQGCLLQIDD